MLWACPKFTCPFLTKLLVISQHDLSVLVKYPARRCSHTTCYIHLRCLPNAVLFPWNGPGTDLVFVCLIGHLLRLTRCFHNNPMRQASLLSPFENKNTGGNELRNFKPLAQGLLLSDRGSILTQVCLTTEPKLWATALSASVWG